MTKGICIAAFSSGAGKTLITLSILRILSKTYNNIQPFKIGPDYIDTQFHQKASQNYSINIDPFMMNEKELKTTFLHYAYNKLPIIEAVMGYYDGVEDKISSYNVVQTINVPVILILSAKGLYSSIAALIKGMITYKKNNNIKAIILNHISSESHFLRIKYIINKEFPKLYILGWVQKDCVDKMPARHLGLDLEYMNEYMDGNFDQIAENICKNINIKEILKLIQKGKEKYYPLFSYLKPKIQEKLKEKKITIVYDNAFSFLYYDNLAYLKELFKELYFISAMENQSIPKDSDIIYLPGGYVETKEIYTKLQYSNNFKNSLIELAKNKTIYAECAGLIYLGKEIINNENKTLPMSNILPLSFKMRNKRKRLGYYIADDIKNKQTYKGHSFHYSDIIKTENATPIMELYKKNNAQIENKKEIGAWTNHKNNIIASYLHILLRTNHKFIENYFLCRSTFN